MRGGRGDSWPCASPRLVSLSCTRLRQNLHRERKARERKNTALRPLLLVPSARLATSVERKGEARQGAGGRNGQSELKGVSKIIFKSEPGRDGGRPLVGRASEFQPLHCWVRRRHFSARRAAPPRFSREVEQQRARPYRRVEGPTVSTEGLGLIAAEESRKIQ